MEYVPVVKYRIFRSDCCTALDLEATEPTTINRTILSNGGSNSWVGMQPCRQYFVDLVYIIYCHQQLIKAKWISCACHLSVLLKTAAAAAASFAVVMVSNASPLSSAAGRSNCRSRRWRALGRHTARQSANQTTLRVIAFPADNPSIFRLSFSMLWDCGSGGIRRSAWGEMKIKSACLPLQLTDDGVNWRAGARARQCTEYQLKSRAAHARAHL